uniref:Uncharacterized protein LOC104243998 n=1 Tax=Nicotiana sylvestris TaxID=4096 RepID=A0A1U7Y385_NICSY|nr:PREDICTED: uncharacterized protein LOC104243998 [Nicotiana sylvestris]
MAAQPVVPVQPVVRATTSEEKQLRLGRYKKYDPPTFSSLASESAYGFLEECHRILRIMGIVESSRVAFTTFQLRGATYKWWWAYELGSSAESVLLTWDAWRVKFEQLRQGTISVSEYAVRFSDLARHAPTLVSTIRERVHQFIEGHHPSIRTSMDWELEIDISYQQTMSIARRVEGMLARQARQGERGQAGP